MDNRTTVKPTYLTPADIIARTKHSKTFVYDLLNSGRVPTLRIDRTIRVREEDWLAFEEKNLAGVNPEAN